MTAPVHDDERLRRKRLTADEVAHMLKLADSGTLVVEIAEVMNMSPRTLADALYRARKSRRATVSV